MKSNVPWSVKGIDPEARVVAKDAARKAGMTLGEWMNQAIREVGDDDGENPSAATGEGVAEAPSTGVTTDQLRAVVDSLNRLNERLRTTEDTLKVTEAKSREAVDGLGQGLETVFERVKRMEREKAEGGEAAIADRLERLERGEGDKGRVEGLKTLERALTHMVEALEVTRSEALDRIGENEEAMAALADRVDVLDSRLTAGFSEVHRAIDAVGEHLDRTERTAKAVMMEAQAAAGSTDAAFVEQTSKRLQVLGNEIKRSGDQIRTVEEMVGRLSEKIEAAEHRSAEGIGEVAGKLEGLRRQVVTGAGAGAAIAPASDDDLDPLDASSLAEATREADRKVSALQRSYEAMMARLEGRSSGEPEAPRAGADQGSEPNPQEASSPLDPQPLAADSLDGDVADGDAEFDAVFGASEDEGEPPVIAAPPAKALSVSTPVVSEEAAGDPGQDLPPTMAELTGAEAAAGESKADRVAKLTPRQKVLLAAKARRKRLAEERDLEGDTTSDAPPSAFDAPLAAERAGVPGGDASGRVSGEDGQNRKVGVVQLALLTVLVVAVVIAGMMMFGGDDAEPLAQIQNESRDQRRGETEAVNAAPLDAPRVDADALYREAKRLQATARGPEDLAEAFRLFQRAADEGSIPARYEVGYAYFRGAGVPENAARAKSHLSDAALAGNVLAMHRLGSIEIEGSVGRPNVTAAIDWFDGAASYGVVDSMYNLGYLYDPASPDNPLPPAERDAAKSYYWYGLAAREGDADAAEGAALVSTTLTPEKVAEIDRNVAAWTPLRLTVSANDSFSLAN